MKSRLIVSRAWRNEKVKRRNFARLAAVNNIIGGILIFCKTKKGIVVGFKK